MSIVSVMTKLQHKNLRRIVSHALASGLRNVMKVDVCNANAIRINSPYEIVVTFSDVKGLDHKQKRARKKR